MKILKINSGKGYFYCISESEYIQIDKIDKDNLMDLLNYFLENEVELDAYDDELVQNQAQKIIYKSIYEKLNILVSNKSKFKDEADRRYLESIQKYQT